MANPSPLPIKKPPEIICVATREKPARGYFRFASHASPIVRGAASNARRTYLTTSSLVESMSLSASRLRQTRILATVTQGFSPSFAMQVDSAGVLPSGHICGLKHCTEHKTGRRIQCRLQSGRRTKPRWTTGRVHRCERLRDCDRRRSSPASGYGNPDKVASRWSPDSLRAPGRGAWTSCGPKSRGVRALTGTPSVRLRPHPTDRRCSLSNRSRRYLAGARRSSLMRR